MYCTKCGKQIDYDSIVCNECKAAESANAAANEETVNANPEVTEAPVCEIEETSPEALAETTEVTEEVLAEDTVSEEAPAAEEPAPEQNGNYENASAPLYANVINNTADPKEDPNNRMYGFGKALASTIVSSFGFLFSLLAFATSATGLSIVGLVLFYPGAIAMSVVSLVLGIKSIKAFRARCKQNCAKPVATLVLGIVGVVQAGFGLLYILLGFLIACTLAAIPIEYYESQYYY